MARQKISNPNGAADIISKLREESEMFKFGGKGILSSVPGYISTGNDIIDYAIHGGLTGARAPAIPMARLTTISGEEQSGKTTLLASIIAQVQKMGGIGALIETEESLDPEYWRQLGVNVEQLMTDEADTFEDVFALATFFINKMKRNFPDTPVVIGWDSINSALDSFTLTELDKINSVEDYKKLEVTGGVYGNRAKDIAPRLRALIHSLSKTKIAFVATNHVQYIMGASKYEEKFDEPGGKAPKFYASIRIRLSTGAVIRGDNEQILGNTIHLKVIKNKLAPQRLQVSVPCIGGIGFDNDYSMYLFGGKTKTLITSGSWRGWNGKKFQGIDGFRKEIVASPDYPKYKEEVLAKLNQEE